MYREALSRLAGVLPPSSGIGQLPDIEEQSRAALSYVVERAMVSDGAVPTGEDAATCPNCGKPVASTRSPYCGESCRETAAFVRQIRSGLQEATIFERDRQVAIGQTAWHLVGGGRPLRLHLVPLGAIARVIARDGGICRECGAPATTVDHVATGCNRPINLRAVCSPCCTDRPFGDPAITQTVEFALILRELAGRVGSERPVRPCDDPDRWDWRVYLANRNKTAAT